MEPNPFAAFLDDREAFSSLAMRSPSSANVLSICGNVPSISSRRLSCSCALFIISLFAILGDRPQRCKGSHRGKAARKIEADGLWRLGAIPGSVLGRVRNRQSSEGNRSERPELPQAGRSEPGKVGREVRPAPGLYQPGGAGRKGRKTANTGDSRRKTLISRVLRV